MSSPEPTMKLVPSTQLWRRYATPEQEQQIGEAINTNIFALLDLCTLEQKLEEQEYGRCVVCNDILTVTGYCDHCHAFRKRRDVTP